MESVLNENEEKIEPGYPKQYYKFPDTKSNAMEDINCTRKLSVNGSVPSSNGGGILTRSLSMEKIPKNKSVCSGCMSTLSSIIINGLERVFFRIGHFVGTYPVLTIIVCLIMCGLTGLGMKTFSTNTEDDTVWVPKGSRLLDERKWVEDTFPAATRYVTFLLVEKDNILTPAVITSMLDYYEQSLKVIANGKKFSQICVKIGMGCSVTSLLELWHYNSTVIRGLTSDDIIAAINSTKTVPESGVEVVTLLGGKFTRDASGAIKSAQATQMTWTSTKEDEDSAKAFEKMMIDIGLEGHADIEHTYVYASRSFDDEGYSAINNDVNLLATGFIIVFVYILFALGKFNFMEQKIYLSLTGMGCVGLSVLVSYGIGTALSIVYSPIQSIMPFLLLGIGVDDMFVVVESWKNLTPEDNKLDVPNKIALCLSKAGVSITVTSVTDVVAFGIGASTVIPALASFCLYATIGIFALFFLVSTLFAAVLALDEKRRKARRDGCLVCYQHSDSYQSCKYSTGRSFLQIVFTNYYGPLIARKPVKIVIITISIVLVSLSMWRFTLMKEDFDLVNYIPSDSYAFTFSRTREDLFNWQGISTRIYCGDFNYWKYRSNLDSMYTEMEESRYIQKGSINAWFTAYHDYLNSSGIAISSEDTYYQQLEVFLKSRPGRIYRPFIKWNATSGPRSIAASYIKATHVREANSIGNIESMDSLREIIDTSGFPKFSGDGLPQYKCLTFVRQYQSLETNKVLRMELYRNLGLAAGAVLIVTIVLVANIRASIMVFICVFFTVVDVGGVLELWGTTIDTASSVLLTLSVGLAVDYSVHIGHTFMTVEGTLEERAILTLKNIGPAVFNGGLSTFLAFILLSNSSSYGFQLFFRVFMSVVIFGMFHGLCLLPVLVSLVGPPSYKELQREMDKDSHSHINGHQKKEMSEKGPESPVEMYGYEGPFSKLYDLKDEDKMDGQSAKPSEGLHEASSKPGPSLNNDSTPKSKHISVVTVSRPESVIQSEEKAKQRHQPQAASDNSHGITKL